MNSRRLIVALDAQEAIVAVPTRCVKGCPMSALGHKRTFATQKGMSALPPKADMCGAVAHVRFGPKADMAKTRKDAAVSRHHRSPAYLGRCGQPERSDDLRQPRRRSQPSLEEQPGNIHQDADRRDVPHERTG